MGAEMGYVLERFEGTAANVTAIAQPKTATKAAPLPTHLRQRQQQPLVGLHEPKLPRPDRAKRATPLLPDQPEERRHAVVGVAGHQRDFDLSHRLARELVGRVLCVDKISVDSAVLKRQKRKICSTNNATQCNPTQTPPQSTVKAARRDPAAC